VAALIKSVLSNSNPEQKDFHTTTLLNMPCLLLVSCRLAMDCMPLRCSINKHISKQPELLSWLQRNQQRQQELCEALSDVRSRQLFWNLFAVAEQRVYELAKGRSQLLGCKLPQVRLEEQWSDRLGSLEAMSATMLADPLGSLWSCLKGHYLIMPAEGALAYLMDQQQQQQEGVEATSKNKSTTSNSRGDGEGAAWAAGAAAAAVAALGDSGGSTASVLLEVSTSQCKARFDVGCLWLFHQPMYPHDSTQTVDGTVRKEGAQDLAQAAASAGPTSGVEGPLTSSSSTAAAAAGGGGGYDGGVNCTLSGRVRGGQSEGVSVAELQLVVNMLLLLWPQMRSSDAGGRQGGGKGAAAAAAAAAAAETQPDLPKLSLELQCWDGLLLLAALLQQAPAQAKQQLMKDHGTLLLQLLYHVLLDHEAMGKRKMDTARVLQTVENLGEILKKVDGSWDWQNCGSMTAEPMSVVQLVLMVVQSLIFVVDPGLEHQAGTLLEDGMGVVIRGGYQGKLVCLVGTLRSSNVVPNNPLITPLRNSIKGEWWMQAEA
jgi:hypothetical protein